MYMTPFIAKATVTAYIGQLSARQYDALPNFFSTNATWWVSGNPASISQAGTKLASDQLSVVPQLLSLFDEYSYNITNIVSSDNRVMVEAQAVGKGPADLVYVNNITSSYVVNRDGKIEIVREYPVHSEID